MKNGLRGLCFLALFVLCLFHAAYGEANIVGLYDTDWGEMEITRQTESSGGSGDFIQGHFTEKKYQISGGLKGNVLTNGVWFVPRGGPSGHLELTFSPDGNSFTGKWRNKSSSGWDGNINGKRRGSGGAAIIPSNKDTGPEMAARAFFTAVINKDYGAAWNGLSENSRRRIVGMIAKEANVSESEVRPLMNNPGSEVSISFWDAFRNGEGFQLIAKNARLGSAKFTGNNQASIPLTVGSNSVDFKMFKEGNAWKVGWLETFNQ